MLNRILGGRSQVRLGIRMSADGQVVEAAGRGDADGVGATVAMCHLAAARVGEVMGLGEVVGWSALKGRDAFHCAEGGDALVACVGDANTAAMSHLSTVLRAVRGGWS